MKDEMPEEYCPNCHERRDPWSEYCGKCGTKYSHPPQDESQAKRGVA